MTYLTTVNANDPTMAVGRFKGKRLSQLPPAYLKWLLGKAQGRELDRVRYVARLRGISK